MINMGCGWRNFGKGWTHIDSGNYEHLDAESITDLNQYGTSTVDIIYASHVIEYFDREELPAVLREWRRILKVGGILRVAVPNFKKIVDLYSSGEYTLNSFLGPLYGKMFMRTSPIYHKTIYDLVSLSEVLKDSGFRDLKQWDWRETEHARYDDHSQAYLPHMDKENGTLISLNMECKK